MQFLEMMLKAIQQIGSAIPEWIVLLVSSSGSVTTVLRWVMPVLAFFILLQTARSMLVWKKEPEIWAYIDLPNGARLPISHWENTIGRSPSSDIVLNYPTVSRSHAVLVRADDGSWTITDVGSKGGIVVNKRPVEGKSPVYPGDIISLAGVEIALLPIEVEQEQQEDDESSLRKPGKPGRVLFLVTLFQLLTAMQLCTFASEENKTTIIMAFAGLAAFMWLYFIFMRALQRTGFEVETIAFFLTTLGFSVVASAAPGELGKMFFVTIMAVLIFVLLGWFLRDLERAKKARWFMGGAALMLLAANLLLGKIVYGAQNWIYIGAFSFQPSELVKIAFIYAGTATLDRLLAKRNLTMFILFSGACIGTLALLGDFGTASIFFVAFVVIAFMRSGDLATISLICAGTGFAGMLAVRFKPYIAKRFSAWGHVWAYASTTGYQQTRTLMYAASGGLLGLGAGNGLLKHISAADTDLVFGILCEEWGLIVAIIAVCSLVCLAIFTVRCASVGRSSFYVIAACASMSMLLFQTALNVFGSIDFLPLTGVTFPFVSNGGSSMLASWGLLAFVKAADTRKNASFAIKRPKEEIQ
ncbi:MAG: FtsW/RodA/SpoVE family cell cycle protein [Oscillospiraceae bacterium]|nr:FtsW/RodA/SpoVE family cell cycle protein [Oscillospiraceae bacterium]